MTSDKLALDRLTDLKIPRGGNRDRRQFIKGATALAGYAALLGYDVMVARADPPPEIAKIRFVHNPFLCEAPQYLAEELLRLEGFTEVEYVEKEITIGATLLKAADIAIFGGPSLLPVIDTQPVVALAGLHPGYWELFANARVQAVGDLKGKTVAIAAIGSADHVFLSSILAYIGVDPRTDVQWVISGKISESMRLFVDGKVDAFLAFPVQPQDLQARKIGRVILNTTVDRPWSEYFCCMIAANRDFVAKHPVATRRALRAMLKVTDICAQEPERAARFLVAKGYESRYEVALEVLKSLPYGRWRESNPEDTIRFYALRLHEVGMIRSSPSNLIAQGTDWRFLNDLKKGMKA
jgi:NitT/TauT family transport system substrate-binding protein